MQIKDLPSNNTLASTDVLAKDTSSGTTQKISGSDLATQIKSLGSLLGTGDVVDDLNSAATDKPLSAAQGKSLNDNIANKVKIVNVQILSDIEIAGKTSNFISYDAPTGYKVASAYPFSDGIPDATYFITWLNTWNNQTRINFYNVDTSSHTIPASTTIRVTLVAD